VMVSNKKSKQGASEFNEQLIMGTNKNGAHNYETATPGEYYELMWQAYTNSLAHASGANAIPLNVAREIGSGLLPRNAAGMQVYNGKTYQDIVQYLGNYNAFNVSNSELVDINGKLNQNAKLKYTDFKTREDEAKRAGQRNKYTINYSNGFEKTE